MKAGVFGIGSALPEHIVTNADFAAYLDTTDEWIVRRTGIRERRHLNGSCSLHDLAVAACLQALDDAKREPAEVDHVIVSSVTPDRLMPGLAPGIADAIGANGAGAVDINAACAGFIYGLDQAAALVESGRAKLALQVPERKVFVNVDKIANTSSASIPLALHQAEGEGRLKPGDTVAVAAFGAGFVWGAGVIAWKERVRVAA